MTMDRGVLDQSQQIESWDTLLAAQTPPQEQTYYSSAEAFAPSYSYEDQQLGAPIEEYVPEAQDVYSYATAEPDVYTPEVAGPSQLVESVAPQEYAAYQAPVSYDTPDFAYTPTMLPEYSGSYESSLTPYDASPDMTDTGWSPEWAAFDANEQAMQEPVYGSSATALNWETGQEENIPPEPEGRGLLGDIMALPGKALDVIGDLPMSYVVPGGPGQSIGRQGTVADTAALNTDIPVWSDAARNYLIPGVAQGLSATNPLTYWDNPVGNVIEGANELGAQAVVPVTTGDWAMLAAGGAYGAARGGLAGALAEGVGFGYTSPLDALPDAAKLRSVLEVPQYADEAAALAGEAGQTVVPRTFPAAAAETAPLGVRIAGAGDEAASIYPRLAGETDLAYAVRLRQSGLPTDTIKAIEQANPQSLAAPADVVAKLRTSIDEARPLSTTTKELQSAERSRRVAISESILQRGGYTTEAYDAARAAQGGPLPRVAFDAVSPNFTPAEIQGLRQNVIDVVRADAKAAGHSLYYTEANALDALGKVMGGQLDELRPSDIGLLDHVFGREVTASIVTKIAREAGVRGGVHWPIAGLDFADESKAIIQQFVDNFAGTSTMPLRNADDLKAALRVDLGMAEATRTPGLLDGIKDRPWRGITSKIGGDISDPIAVEMVNQEDQLYRAILMAEVKKIARVNTEGLTEAEKMYFKADEFLQAQEAMNKAREATRLFRNEAFNAIADTERRRELFRALASYDQSRDVAHNALLKKLADVQAPLKEIMLSADFGVALQQGLRGVRMGTSSALTSAVAKVADNVASTLGKNVDSFGIYPNPAISHRAAAEADGLILRGSASVGIERDFASAASDRLLGSKLNIKTPFRMARKGLEKVSDVQYGLLDKFRLQVYEGRLIQEKLLGNNIADPRVRRAIADFANTAGSTARSATNQTRMQAERALMLSPQLSRAQFAEIAQPLKTFTSRTQATNTLNYLASMSATFGLAYAVQSQFGPDMSLEEFLSRSADPTKSTFGRLLVGEAGSAKVTDFLPQFSLERAVIRSINAANAGDLKKIGDSWVKYGTGRLNIVPSGVLNLSGVGYGENGQFFYGDMPVDQRALGALPIPLGVENAVIEGQNDPTSIVINTLGGSAYDESPTSERARTDPELQSAIDLYWEAYDEGFNLAKSEGLATGPYAPLLREAKDYDQLRYLIDEIVMEAQQSDPFLNKNTATQAILRELGITQAAQEVRKAAVRRNPAVIQYLIERGDDIPEYLQDVYEDAQVGQ